MRPDIEQGQHEQEVKVATKNDDAKEPMSTTKEVDLSQDMLRDEEDFDDDGGPTKKKQERPTLTRKEKELQSFLSKGAYHLPGNTTWAQDWYQYFANNHPLMAIVLQNKLHPISRWMRAVGTFGSIMFGLVITNIYFIVIHEKQYQEKLPTTFDVDVSDFEIIQNTTVVIRGQEFNVSDYASFFDVSTELMILWTLGSAIHAVFDNFMWYVTACSCILANETDEEGDDFKLDDDTNSIEDEDKERYSADEETGRRKSTSTTSSNKNRSCLFWMSAHRRFCNVLIVLVVVLITAAASLAVVIRANVEAGEDADQFFNDFISRGLDYDTLSNKDNYEFLTSYAIELAVAWFFWFPVVETIMFSGILSCGGRLPFGGGRPAEMKVEQGEEEHTDDCEERDAFEVGMSGEIYHVTAENGLKSNEMHDAGKSEGVDDLVEI